MIRTTRQPRLFYGWYIVMACFTIGLFTNVARTSFTMWFPHLLTGLEGATRTNLGFGTTLHSWLASFMALAAGMLLDRYGPRVLMTFGGALTILGLAMSSQVESMWGFYFWFGCVLSIAGAATHGIPTHITGRKWFTRKAGLAVAISSIGGTLGIAVIAFLAPPMIKALGWRSAWLWLGVITGTPTIILAWLVIRKDPESMGLRPDGDPPLPVPNADQVDAVAVPIEEVESWTVKQAMKTSAYWFLVMGHAIAAIPVTGALGHVAMWALDVANKGGVAKAQAMPMVKLGVFMMAIGAIIGTIVGGPLSDRFGRKFITSLSFILFGICWIFGCFVTKMWQVPVWTFINASTYGLGITIWAAYMGDIYGRKSMATLYGLLILLGGIIGGSGAWIFGWIFDHTGGYCPAFIGSTVCCAVSLVLLILTKHKPLHHQS